MKSEAELFNHLTKNGDWALAKNLSEILSSPSVVWNGESYFIDNQTITPVYQELAEEEFEVIGYNVF